MSLQRSYIQIDIFRLYKRFLIISNTSSKQIRIGNENKEPGNIKVSQARPGRIFDKKRNFIITKIFSHSPKTRQVNLLKMRQNGYLLIFMSTKYYLSSSLNSKSTKRAIFIKKYRPNFVTQNSKLHNKRHLINYKLIQTRFSLEISFLSNNKTRSVKWIKNKL